MLAEWPPQQPTDENGYGSTGGAGHSLAHLLQTQLLMGQLHLISGLPSTLTHTWRQVSLSLFKGFVFLTRLFLNVSHLVDMLVVQ